MKVVTLSRKPCTASSTTANVVEHEAGALNVDGCRVGDAFISAGGNNFDAWREGEGREDRPPAHGNASAQPRSGRWPANAILLHRTGCEQDGTIVVPGYTINRWSDGAKPFGGGAGHEYESEEQPDENVVVWKCGDGCAVGALDRGAGWLVPRGNKHQDPAGGGMFGHKAFRRKQVMNYGDAGNASRFFKQVQETKMDELPQELLDYLTTLISPPPECEPLVLVQADLEEVAWEEYEDSSIHGIITVGNPEPHMEDIDRVLRPGAHLLIVAPDDEPTGHTGACAVEDFGYEIRDAIAVLDTPGEFHYVAKASSAERNAGVVARDSETGRTVQNDHPTVKAVGIMQALLHDVPEGATVIDPFMGSGTTGIACLRTGHSFIGIDQDAAYLRIADQRIRHWDRAETAWNGATIESEAEFEEEESVGLEELFGM